MLQNIREKLTGWVALAVLGAIGLSFVFVGGANFATIGQSYAAKVDGIDIGTGQFENAYREQLRQNPQLASLPDEYRLQLRSNILEQLIQQRVVDNYLVDAGVQVSTQELTQYVHQVPDFQVDGKFDQETYVQVLQLNNLTVSEYEQSQLVSLRRDQLQRAIRGTAVVSPSSYRRFLNLAFENRVITTATLSAETVASEISVSDEMITAYYDSNPTMFQIPESADVEYIEVTREAVAKEVAVTEEQLREYYELEKDRLRQDEQRQARHILILFDDDEAGAEVVATEILTRARSGESFAELARKYSKDGGTASNGGDLGALTETQLPDALGEAIFSMDEGDVRGPIKGDFGFHIARLDRILESGPLPYEQVRASLLVELQDREADGLFLAFERELSDALFDAPDIRTLAAAVGAEVKTVEGFSRAGGEPFAASQAAIDAIFDPTVLSGAQMSDIVELDADRTVVFSVVKHNLATRQPLDSVREQVETALVASTSEELMAGRAQQMLDALAAGEEFAVAAEAVGAAVQTPSLMSRNDENADQFMMAAVFTAPKPTQDKPTTGSTRNGSGGYTVYSIDAVIPGRPEQIPLADRDSGKLQLTDQYGVGDFVAFVQSLRADAEIIINEDVLAAQDLFQ